jgi:hypothetical protein
MRETSSCTFSCADNDLVSALFQLGRTFFDYSTASSEPVHSAVPGLLSVRERALLPSFSGRRRTIWEFTGRFGPVTSQQKGRLRGLAVVPEL